MQVSLIVVVPAEIMAITFLVEIIGPDSRTKQKNTSDTNTMLENLPQVLRDKFELLLYTIKMALF